MGMIIESYSFGRMVIEGTEYGSDLIIFPDGRILDGWWRKSGHRLCWDDLAALTAAEPEVLVVGTGATGLMRIEADVENRLREQRVALHAARTAQAIELYNTLSGSGRTGACFHLTC